MADHRRYRTFLPGFFIAAKNSPHMLQRHQESRMIAVFHFHAVIGTIINTAISVLRHARHVEVRPAVHLMMFEQRQLVKIDSIAGLNNLLDRRRIFADDHRPDLSSLAAQTFPRHLCAVHVGRQPKSDLNLFLRILRAHHDFHIRRLPMSIERIFKDQYRKFLQCTELFDDSRDVVGQRIDGFRDRHDFARINPAHVVEKSAKRFGHPITHL